MAYSCDETKNKKLLCIFVCINNIMKLTSITLILIAFLSFSLTQSSTDDCKSYYPLEQGIKMTYEQFDKKNKLTGTTTTFVKSVNSLGTNTEYVLEVSGVSAKPKKDEVPFKKEFTYVCTDGVLSFDMSSFVPKETLAAFGNQPVELEQSEIVLPKSLEVGQKLNDGYVKLIMGGVDFMTVNIINRTVEKMETITTEAGTYNCALITSETNMVMSFMSIKSTSKEWYSTEVGMVKSETYDKKGKLTGSQKLKAYSK